MALTELWLTSRHQLERKHISQIIAFAGSGHLRDGSETSEELRAFLDLVPSRVLARYVDECLAEGFVDSGLVLQDIVNQIGRRLGFLVADGRYRGTRNTVAYDGLWRLRAQGHPERTIIVEVKTSDTYRIELRKLAAYRQSLIDRELVEEASSSLLLVMGRRGTDDIEAQIRGSRYAWDMRLISVDALMRLVKLKESVDDPAVAFKLCNMLVPHEFTRLDTVIEVLYAAAEDVREREYPPLSDYDFMGEPELEEVGDIHDPFGLFGSLERPAARPSPPIEALETAPAPELEPEVIPEPIPEVTEPAPEPRSPVLEAEPPPDDVGDAPEEDAEEIPEPDPEPDEPPSVASKRFQPAKVFHRDCVDRVEHHMRRSLARRSRSCFSSPDHSIGVVCLVSKPHEHRGALEFWFALHSHQRDFLEQYEESFLAFGCGSAAVTLLVPFETVDPWLPAKCSTRNGGYWQIRARVVGDGLVFTRGGKMVLELVDFLI